MEQTEFVHKTVMLNETLEGLECKSGLIYVDATMGGGGHSYEIAKKTGSGGRLICLDVDDDAIAAASKKLAPFADNVTIVKSSYAQIAKVLKNINIEKITGGIIFDLGASFHQLTKAERGFSFMKEAPLDMRFNQSDEQTAYNVINLYKEEELVRIFSEYGEERFSKRIARSIVERRKISPIKTTTDLAEIIVKATPNIKSKIHPATRVFQAVRIEVNAELKNIESTLKVVITLLEKNAKICIISFHSLEDRLVKNSFKYYSRSCNCLPNQAICNCPPRQLEVETKKPILPSVKEIRENPASRSAKLRIARKV